MNQPVKPALNEQQTDRMFKWLLHEGALYVGRQQYFAISEAVLVAAFATILSASSPTKRALLALLIAGLLTSAIWLYTNVYQLKKNIYPIRDLIRPHMEEWKYIDTGRAWWIRATTATGIFMPVVFAGLWVALFLFTAPHV